MGCLKMWFLLNYFSPLSIGTVCLVPEINIHFVMFKSKKVYEDFRLILSDFEPFLFAQFLVV